jgi:hypothetical protein
MVALVKQIVQLHADLRSSRIPHIRSFIERQAASIDDEIDAIVYTLYGLTDEEIMIVKAAVP